MAYDRLEQKLQHYFLEEVRKVEPSSEWWDRAISRLEQPREHFLWANLVPRTRLAWLLVPLILALIGGAVYGATTLIQKMFQTYAPSVENAGLGQEIDLSQTIDGVTVKLERAYADSNVVLLGYTISGPQERYSGQGELTTTDGQSLPMMAGFGSMPGSEILLGDWPKTERAANMTYFEASSIAGTPAELNLSFKVEVTGSTQIFENEIDSGPFVFSFKIPFHPGKVVNIGQTVEAAGVPITLEQVTISPWGTRAVYTFYPPYLDKKARPMPITSLRLPNGESKQPVLEKTGDTYSAEYYWDNLTNRSGEWTLTLDELVFSPDPSLGPGEHPASATKRLGGPWVFHFLVP